MPSRVEDRIEEFGEWYRREKAEIWSRTYHNRGGFFQEFGNPFRSWTRSHYISTETDVTSRAIVKLGDLFPNPTPEDLQRLSLVTLTAKNRAETISSKSDFYPVYTAVVSAGVAAITLGLPDYFKPVPIIGALIVVFVGATIRMKTREQAAYLKELANILDNFP